MFPRECTAPPCPACPQCPSPSSSCCAPTATSRQACLGPGAWAGPQLLQVCSRQDSPESARAAARVQQTGRLRVKLPRGWHCQSHARPRLLGSSLGKGYSWTCNGVEPHMTRLLEAVLQPPAEPLHVCGLHGYLAPCGGGRPRAAKDDC